MPEGMGDGREIVRGAGRTVTLKAFPTTVEALSVTATVKEKKLFVRGTGVLGVPLRTPLADRLTPGGRDPEETDQIMGDTPPFALSVARNGSVAYSLGNGDVFEIVKGLIVICVANASNVVVADPATA